MNKIKKLTDKKLFRFLLVTALVVMMCPILVYADEATDAVTKLANLFSGVVKVIGFIIGVFSFTILGPGVSQQDSSQIRNGILLLVGGVLMFFHVELLTLMGISI